MTQSPEFVGGIVLGDLAGTWSRAVHRTRASEYTPLEIGDSSKGFSVPACSTDLALRMALCAGTSCVRFDERGDEVHSIPWSVKFRSLQTCREFGSFP